MRIPTSICRGLRVSGLGILFAACTPLSTADDPRPRITGISHAAIFVHDIEKSRAFYTGLLGFVEPYSVNQPDGTLHLTWMKINDRQTLELFPEKEAASDRLNHFAIETDDAEAMRRYLASKGVAVPPAVSKGKIGNSNFTVTDPDGHGVEIVEYEPDGWTALNKGKFMPETRVSARMTHVGILVGPLEPALAFYRDILGFQETWRGSRDGDVLSWVNMKVPDGDDYVELMLYKDLPLPDQRGTQHHVCLEVPDVAASLTALKTRPFPEGCKPPTAIRIGINGKRQINFYDPDGTRVEIMEPAPSDGVPVRHPQRSRQRTEDCALS